MKNRLMAVLACVLSLWGAMTWALAEEEPLPPTVTIQYFEEGPWYPLLAPNDTPLTAEGLPHAITGVDSQGSAWEVPVRWDLEVHHSEISSFQDFTACATPEDTLTGPDGTTYRIETEGIAAEPFALPVYFFTPGPIGTDLEGLKGNYIPWSGQLTLTYNKVGFLEAAPPGASKVLLQASTDQQHWQTLRDVTGEIGGRFSVEVPAQRTEAIYYRVWVEGGPQAGASTEYVVMEANAALPQAHTVTLEDLVVKSGEQAVYQTVGEGLLDAPENGLYPGELTIEIKGRVVVESGGSLRIGTFSSGSSEKRPVLRGALSQEGLIQVKPGGALELDGVVWDLEGEAGCAVRQEDGGAVRLDNTELDPTLVQWGAPLVDNSHLTLQDVWLEEGTPLTAALLPQSAQTWVLDQGASALAPVPIRWELGEAAGRTEGEAVIPGRFLNEAGEPMDALSPLEIAVRWYTPQVIPVTGTSWLGDATPTARLEFLDLPEQAAEVWGEWSEDGGDTWTRWDQCVFMENSKGPYCVFTAPDSTPRLYRAAAVSADGTLHWASEGVLLPGEGTVPEDPDGNRGGSTGVVRPDRELEPEPEDTDEPSVPSASQTPALPAPAAPQQEEPAPQPPAQPSAEVPEVPAPAAPPPQDQGAPAAEAEEQGPVPEPDPPQETAPEGPSPAPEEPPQAQPAEPEAAPPPPEDPLPPPSAEDGRRPLPAAAQAALAAAGLGGCALAGLGLTRGGPFKKKR